jgi:hypothetical protein
MKPRRKELGMQTSCATRGQKADDLIVNMVFQILFGSTSLLLFLEEVEDAPAIVSIRG